MFLILSNLHLRVKGQNIELKGKISLTYSQIVQKKLIYLCVKGRGERWRKAPFIQENP